jgi:hypothetical protein
MRPSLDLKLLTTAAAAVLFVSAFHCQVVRAQEPPVGAPITLPPVTTEMAKDLNAQNTKNAEKDATRLTCPGGYRDISTETPYSSQTFYACKTTRGTTTTIPEAVVKKYCSDTSGCIVRIGMQGWDDTGRVASRHFLFFYNPAIYTWRAELGDTQGTNINEKTEHINNSWSCYFTDGLYANWQDLGDKTLDFGLLSWNQYNADCFLTFIK